MFSKLPNAAGVSAPKNVFQRLDQSSQLWKAACTHRYEDVLSGGEMADLKQLFQRRHLLAHRDGIVDQEYIDRSGDGSYAVGQRLVVKPESILRLAGLLHQLSVGIRSWVSGSPQILNQQTGSAGGQPSQ